MAFTGTPIVTQVADGIVRITGVALPAAGSGTIGLFGATGSAPNVRLPEAFRPSPYRYGDHDVALADAIDVSFRLAATGAPLCNPVVIKTGTTVQNFRATITTELDTPTPDLEIWVKYHE